MEYGLFLPFVARSVDVKIYACLSASFPQCLCCIVQKIFYLFDDRLQDRNSDKDTLLVSHR